MDSLDLYHTRQQYLLGSYKPLIEAQLPDKFSPDYQPTLLYRARALVFTDPTKAIQSLPNDELNLPARAVRSLATYFNAKSTDDDEAKEKALDELRDLCVEIEGEEVAEDVKGTVRSVAAVAFVQEGELEEAQETLQGTEQSKNLETIALTVQLHLLANRTDLAQKEYEKAKKWADDDTLLQLIEASVDLVTGKNNYSNPYSFYTEQSHNPSLTSPHLITAKGITHLLRGELPQASSDFKEALDANPQAFDALAATIVLRSRGGQKSESDALFDRLKEQDPEHPLVKDLAKKSELFDTALAGFTVPPLRA